MKDTGLIVGGLLVAFLLFWPKREAAAATPTPSNGRVQGPTFPSGHTWSEIEEAFREASYEWGIPAGVLRAMADVESAFRPEIISGEVKGAAGEIGIMQITPRWHPNVDPYNPIHSIWYAAGWLRDLYDRFGSWRLAVAAYNWGPTNLANKGYDAAPSVTKNYVNRVAAQTGI